MTYPLYLIHSPLGLVVMQQIYQATHSSVAALTAAFTVVLLVAASILLLEPAVRAIGWRFCIGQVIAFASFLYLVDER